LEIHKEIYHEQTRTFTPSSLLFVLVRAV